MRTLFALAILCPFLSTSQQLSITENISTGNTASLRPDTPLAIGSVVPDLRLPTVINHGSPSTGLHSFTDRPLLLCFFATWCSTCAREVPKLVQAKERWADSLEVLMVTYEGRQQWEAARKKHPLWASITLPVVLADSALKALFPYRMVPHLVWVRQGRVAAITGAEALTGGNMETFVQGRPLSLPLKKDILDFNPAKPLLWEGNGGSTDALRYRSSLMAYLPGMGSSSGSRREGGLLRSWYINQPVLSLYTTILGLQPAATILEAADTARYYIPAVVTTAWKEAGLFSYEQVVPAALTKEERQQAALADLNRFLGLQGRWERRTLPCLVLKRTGKQQPSSAGGEPLFSVQGADSTIMLRNMPLSRLIAAINHQPAATSPRPLVLDESGITTPVDMVLRATLADRTGMGKALAPYGLTLVEARRQLNVFVLTETPQSADKTHDHRKND